MFLRWNVSKVTFQRNSPRGILKYIQLPVLGQTAVSLMQQATARERPVNWMKHSKASNKCTAFLTCLDCEENKPGQGVMSDQKSSKKVDPEEKGSPNRLSQGSCEDKPCQSFSEAC